MLVLMSEPALKCESHFQAKLYSKTVHCFKNDLILLFSGLKGNLNFPDFLQKKFYNIYYWSSLDE